MTTEDDLHAAVLAGDWSRAQEIGHQLDGQNRQRATLTQAALWYAEQGIPVFPCHPRKKIPATAHGFLNASTDPQRIRAWWSSMPAANIGAATGELFDVIDVDGPVGIASIAPYVHQIRAQSIGIVTTPRPGGLHYYLPPDRKRARNTAKQEPGIDTRVKGGYVLLPPSITDEHGEGRSYRWLRPLRLPVGRS